MGNKLNVLAEYDNKHSLYKDFTSEVERLLNSFLIDNGIKCNAITSRLKDRDSLIEKIDRKNDKYQNLDNITDIAGIRVITYFAEDVDKVANIIEREFTIDNENSIDQRKALDPDRFGYCSVHYVVEMNQSRLELSEYKKYSGLKCEIQIRSVLQHAWAEIEHDFGYKSEIGIPQSIRRSFSRLAGLLEIADKEFQEIRLFLQSYQDEAIEKIQQGELADVEIDAILLKTTIKTDKNIIKINKQLTKFFGINIEASLTISDLEHTINFLRWLHINTMSDLRDFIFSNQECAIAIASEVSSKYNKAEGDTMKKTLAFLYLCYAELLKKNYSYDEVVEFLLDNNFRIVEGNTDFAKELLRIRKKLNIPIDKNES